MKAVGFVDGGGRGASLEFCFESINWSPYFGRRGVRVADLVDAAASAGYAWISFDEALLAVAREQGSTLSALARSVRDAGLRTLAIHALALSDDRTRDAALARPLLDAANALEAPFIASGVSAPLDDAVLENVAEIAETAVRSGAALALEFLPFLPVATIEATRSVMRACRAGGARMVVDSWHFFHGPDDWDALASIEPDEIAYIQFDDHPSLETDDLLEETTERRVLPGDGTFDLTRFASVLRDRGFDGVVGLELLSRGSRQDDPKRVARELIDASRPYWIGSA